MKIYLFAIDLEHFLTIVPLAEIKINRLIHFVKWMNDMSLKVFNKHQKCKLSVQKCKLSTIIIQSTCFDPII